MKKIFFVFWCITRTLLSSAASEEVGNVFTVSDDSLQITVSCVRDKVIHVQVVPVGTVVSPSLIVPVETIDIPGCRITEKEKEISLQTPDVTATYQYDNTCIRFTDTKSGEVLLQEQARSFVRKEVAGEQVWQVKQSFQLTPDEAVYGLGQYQEGTMNYRGQKAKLVQANMEIVNPLLVSTRPYGLLWDNYSKTLFEDNTEGASFWSEVADAIDYYFIYGTDMDEVIAGYHNLTGKVPMFPKSAFGYWQSKERYKSFDELTEVVAEHRRRAIPIDNIVQDWEYWGERPYWNKLAFDTLHFRNPAEVINRLHNRYHVKLMLSVWPGFGKKTDIYHALDSIGALFDEPTWADYKVMDIYNPKAQQLFWEHLYDGLFSKGVDSWWMDATEPSFREGFTQDKQEEKTKSAGKTHIGSFHRYLNVYSLFLSKVMYENLRKQNDKRVCILTRSAFAGQQQYGTAVWSGDITASWDVFRKQLPAGLNMCMTGIPYWTTDIGGFFVTTRGAEYVRGLDDPAYKELYLRWFQQSTFSPLLRAHGSNVPREVWQFGKPGEPVYDGLVSMIKLRYRLLSYIYSSAWQVTASSRIMMRGLAMDFPNDPQVHNASDAYMFGSALLVHPVTTPGCEQLPVYLPVHKGTYWFDFYNQKSYTSGQTISCRTPLDRIPVFVKGGSILPFNQDMQYATEKKDVVMDICVYGGADARFELYEDDNETYGYEKGQYSLIPFSWDNGTSTLTIGDKQGDYKDLEQRTFRIKLYLPVENKDKPVLQEVQVKYENKQQIVKF